MSEDIKFQDWRLSQPYSTGSASKMNQWLIKKGIARDEKQASYVLTVLACINLFLVVVLFYFAFKSNPVKNDVKKVINPTQFVP